MPEDYEPTIDAYEGVVETTIDLAPVDLTEEEINSALEELYNG
ncbi:hypothetical protein PNQ92_05515 [Halobacterium salinarum]|nr:hypothetical protein [Halobacterium salinarum]MDL0124867.1 hypothetical protein [Halobacterium salinarum]